MTADAAVLERNEPRTRAATTTPGRLWPLIDTRSKDGDDEDSMASCCEVCGCAVVAVPVIRSGARGRSEPALL